MVSCDRFVSPVPHHVSQRERKIPKELRKRIVQYYELFLSWSESFDEDGVLVDLTENLRREVLLHVHRNIIEKVPFLSTIDPGFMSHVFAIMIPSFALPGEVVVQQGDVARHMYFIITGTVSVVRYLENGEEEVLGDLGGGDHFGELAILTEEPHAEAVRARRFCKMFLIEKADFDVMLVSTVPHGVWCDCVKMQLLSCWLHVVLVRRSEPRSMVFVCPRAVSA